MTHFNNQTLTWIDFFSIKNSWMEAKDISDNDSDWAL